MLELIKKKRNGQALSEAEIRNIVDGFATGRIPDYQVAAFLMAVYFQGLNNSETATLTDAMMRSGELIDLTSIPGIKVDKHSTGGVGDKTTLVLAPLVAAAGVPVAKMSGRGLGHTGGTLDKLEAIPGLSIDLSQSAFIAQIKKHGLAICGQNTQLVPADKKLYALRDVTGTVDNISLISSSIMSKKLACGADAIVIDIKVGEGAFMKTIAEAKQLAQMIIGTGAQMNRKVVAVISAMHEPLGYAVGNALEVQEAIDTLQGKGPRDLTELCYTLGSQMLLLSQAVGDFEEGVEKLKALIASGAAFEKFKALVQAQGGDVAAVTEAGGLPQAALSRAYVSPREGYLHQVNALGVGLASVKLGAGRATKDSEIDRGAGILLKKKVGDYVKAGETLAILYSSQEERLAAAVEILKETYVFEPHPPEQQPLILDTID